MSVTIQVQNYTTTEALNSLITVDLIGVIIFPQHKHNLDKYYTNSEYCLYAHTRN